MLKWSEIETRSIEFQNNYYDEKHGSINFVKDFIDVFGIDFKDGFNDYKLILKDGSIGYIDYFLPGKILIEMKSKGNSLDKSCIQVMNYIDSLKNEEKPKIVMISNFEEIVIYNLEEDAKPNSFKVNELKDYINLFNVIVG